jgi:RNA polymerase sigma-70 factor (ECF subfamily)
LKDVSASWQSLNQETDERLAACFLGGEQDALAVLFDRYHRLVFSVAMRILRDSGEAEEVVQTVFLDICRAMANFDPRKGTLKVWLLQYAYHRSLHRKRHLQASHFYNWVELDSAVSDVRFSASLDEAIDRSRLMKEWLGMVNENRRAILLLTYCEGLTAEEVAVKLNQSIHVVRHELYRALAHLRKEVAKKNAAASMRLRSELEGAQSSNAPAI